MRGSLHPANLLMLAFADVFGASDFNREFWGPPGFPWHDMIRPDRPVRLRRMSGRSMPVRWSSSPCSASDWLRGLLWAREIRFFTVAMLFTLLYALGKYTPVFPLIYDYLAGRGALPPAGRRDLRVLRAAGRGRRLSRSSLSDRHNAGARAMASRAGQSRSWRRSLRFRSALAHRGRQLRSASAADLLWGVGFIAAAVVALALARRVAAPQRARRRGSPCGVQRRRFRLEQRAERIDRAEVRNLRGDASDTKDETVALLKSKLAAAAAPDRRDRVELIGVAYHWPNIGLIHDFDHLFGHNPLRLADFARATAAPDTVAGAGQRPFTPLLPSYARRWRDLFGVRFVASACRSEKIDGGLQAGRSRFGRAHRDRLHL